MTLQTSSTITLAQIQSEHGGSNPIGMNEYYRGGSNVQNHNNTDGTFNATAIPTSGTISLSQFYGSANNATVVGNTFAILTSSSYIVAGAKYGDTFTGFDDFSLQQIGSGSDKTIQGSNGTNFTIRTCTSLTSSVGNFPQFRIDGNYFNQTASSVFGYTSVKWGSTTIFSGLGSGTYDASTNTTFFGGTMPNIIPNNNTANVSFA